MQSALIGVLCLSIGGGAGWFISSYQQGKEQHVASEVAARYLEGRSLNASEFYGPVVNVSANTPRVFSWRSLSSNPSLRPFGDMVCLYEVAGPEQLKKIQCEEPR